MDEWAISNCTAMNAPEEMPESDVSAMSTLSAGRSCGGLPRQGSGSATTHASSNASKHARMRRMAGMVAGQETVGNGKTDLHQSNATRAVAIGAARMYSWRQAGSSEAIAPATTHRDRMKSIIAQELQKIGASSPVAFEVTFADGETYRNQAGPPAFSMRFRSHAAELGIAAFGHIGMCDAYFDGGLDIEGDLRAAFRAGMSSGFVRQNVLVEPRIAGANFATPTPAAHTPRKMRARTTAWAPSSTGSGSTTRC